MVSTWPQFVALALIGAVIFLLSRFRFSQTISATN